MKEIISHFQSWCDSGSDTQWRLACVVNAHQKSCFPSLNNRLFHIESSSRILLINSNHFKECKVQCQIYFLTKMGCIKLSIKLLGHFTGEDMSLNFNTVICLSCNLPFWCLLVHSWFNLWFSTFSRMTFNDPKNKDVLEHFSSGIRWKEQISNAKRKGFLVKKKWAPPLVLKLSVATWHYVLSRVLSVEEMQIFSNWSPKQVPTI